MIGILTFHDAANYGAVLQAYALCTFVSRTVGTDAKIIDYHCEKIVRASSLKAQLRSSNPLKHIVKCIVMGGKLKETLKGFEKFRNDYFHLSPKSYGPSTRFEIGDDFDVIIVGSDQVWNAALTGSDFTYLLDFCSEKVNKLSYAASIGDIPKDEKTILMLKKYLSSFNHISAREYSMAQWIQGTLGLKCSINIDPVLLIPSRQWAEMTQNDHFEGKYVLCYNVQDSTLMKDYIEIAKTIAKKNGWKVKYLSTNGHLKNRKGIEIENAATPSRFLSLIQHAEYVVTDSFHGTAFSILFHRNFYVASNVKRIDRIRDLLSLTSLSDRMIDANSFGNYCSVKSSTWAHVDEVIDSERSKSAIYFQKYITNKNQ